MRSNYIYIRVFGLTELFILTLLGMENKNQTKNSVSNFTNLLEFFHIVANLKVNYIYNKNFFFFFKKKNITRMFIFKTLNL
jgi:hypothetical protein